ncbi:hypothetical protein BDF22DRAFT_685646, partial [Syncephalis plumigaleata]
MNKLLSIMLITCVYTIIQTLVYTNVVDVCDVQKNVSLFFSLFPLSHLTTSSVITCMCIESCCHHSHCSLLSSLPSMLLYRVSI